MNKRRPTTRRRFQRGGLAKTVKNILRKASETKALYQPIQLVAGASTDGAKTDVVNIAQGTAGDQRIGSTLQLRHIEIKGSITSTGVTASQLVRLLLFYSTSEDATSLTLQDYLTGSYNPKEFFPLIDKYIRLEPYYDGTNTVVRDATFSFSKSIKYYQKYNGALSSDLTSGHLIMAITHLNDPNVNHTLNARLEVWYDDL